MKITEPTPNDLRLAKSADFQHGVAMTIGVLGFGFIPVSIAIGIWQCIRWLNDGYWPAANWMTAFEWFGIPYPMTEAIGLQKIIDWLMGLSLWTLPIALALVCLIGMNILAGLESKEGNAARSKILTWKRHQDYLKRESR